MKNLVIIIAFTVLSVGGSFAHESEESKVASTRKAVASSAPGEVAQSASQYHFSYSTRDTKGAKQFREEKKTHDGQVSGKYGYVDPNGHLRVVNYEAGDDGFIPQGAIGPDEETLRIARQMKAEDDERKRPFLDYWNQIAQRVGAEPEPVQQPVRQTAWVPNPEKQRYVSQRPVHLPAQQKSIGTGDGYEYSAQHTPKYSWDSDLTDIRRSSHDSEGNQKSVWSYQQSQDGQQQTLNPWQNRKQSAYRSTGSNYRLPQYRPNKHWRSGQEDQKQIFHSSYEQKPIEQTWTQQEQQQEQQPEQYQQQVNDEDIFHQQKQQDEVNRYRYVKQMHVPVQFAPLGEQSAYPLPKRIRAAPIRDKFTRVSVSQGGPNGYAYSYSY